MYYPLKLLREGLQDVENTKAFILNHIHPETTNSEVAKVDLTIQQMKGAIKLLENSKRSSIDPSDYGDIYEKSQLGLKIQDIARQYGVSYKTIQRTINKYKKLL